MQYTTYLSSVLYNKDQENTKKLHEKTFFGGFWAETKEMVSVLNTFLRADANSASCAIAYQPKAPKELARYRRRKLLKNAQI